MHNVDIIHYAVFWNGSNGLPCSYFVNNGLQGASMNRCFFLISDIKWYKNKCICIIYICIYIYAYVYANIS